MHSTGTAARKLTGGNSPGPPPWPHQAFVELFVAETFPIDALCVWPVWEFLWQIQDIFQCLHLLPNILRNIKKFMRFYATGKKQALCSE